jgi:hypothetical protein
MSFMTEEAIDTAGWLVRVTKLPWAAEFYLVGHSDDDVAIGAVRKRVGALRNEMVEAVAVLSTNAVLGHDLRPGEVRQCAIA